MQKLISFPNSHNIVSPTIKYLFSFFCSLPETRTTSSCFENYLIDSFNLPKSRALALSNQYSYIKSLEKPENVRQFFQSIGFSDTHIRSTVRASPQVLVCNVDKTLKPKIEFFQNLGVVGSDLGMLISRNSFFLTVSLEKKLIPFVEKLKQVLLDDKNNDYLLRTIRRCNWVFGRNPNSRLLRNIELFKSWGIVGSQLSMLLKSKPRLFGMPESKLNELVSRVSGMGFLVNSRMFVHGLYMVSSLSEETVERKFELFRSYGFSNDEFMGMTRKVPGVLRTSEEKLKSGLEFFLRKVELEKAAFLNLPICLMYSMENRVIPRYRVFKILTSRKLLKNECIFPQMLVLAEEKFLQKFVLSFRDVAEELLLAYKGQNLRSLSSSSSSSSSEEGS